MNEEKLKIQIKQIMYNAFKRGIGWKLMNPDSKDFHIAATQYANDELELELAEEAIKTIIK